MNTFAYITQNEAPTEILIGPFPDSTGPMDHQTELTSWLESDRREHDVLRVVVMRAVPPS